MDCFAAVGAPVCFDLPATALLVGVAIAAGWHARSTAPPPKRLGRLKRKALYACAAAAAADLASGGAWLMNPDGLGPAGAAVARCLSWCIASYLLRRARRAPASLVLFAVAQTALAGLALNPATKAVGKGAVYEVAAVFAGLRVLACASAAGVLGFDLLRDEEDVEVDFGEPDLTETLITPSTMEGGLILRHDFSEIANPLSNEPRLPSIPGPRTPSTGVSAAVEAAKTRGPVFRVLGTARNDRGTFYELEVAPADGSEKKVVWRSLAHLDLCDVLLRQSLPSPHAPPATPPPEPEKRQCCKPTPAPPPPPPADPAPGPKPPRPSRLVPEAQHLTELDLHFERLCAHGAPPRLDAARRDALANALLAAPDAAPESPPKPKLIATKSVRKTKAPTLLRGALSVTADEIAVCAASNFGSSMRESYGTLSSGRVLYRVTVSEDGAPKWRLHKTFAQLRALLGHCSRLDPAAPWPKIQRPKPPPKDWSQAGEPLSWVVDEVAAAAATAVLATAAISPPAAEAFRLFCESDISEGVGDAPYAWDLVVVGDPRAPLVQWRPCDFEDDARRRTAARRQTAADAGAAALNLAPLLNLATYTDSNTDVEALDLGGAAYRASAILVASLEAAGAPRGERCEVGDDASFERVDREDEAGLLCGGDGTRAAANSQRVPENGEAPPRFSKRRAIRESFTGRRWSRSSRTSASLPPQALRGSLGARGSVGNRESFFRDSLASRLSVDDDDLEDARESLDNLDAAGASPRGPGGRRHVADGSQGGCFVRLARVRNALLHTSAWREFRTAVGRLSRAELDERGDARDSVAARAATLVNVHACVAFHGALVAGAGSGRPESDKRCREAQRYALGKGFPLGVNELDLALAREPLPPHVNAALERCWLLPNSATVLAPPRALEIQAGLLLSSTRAGAPGASAHPPRPGPSARRSLRTAARRLIDASLDLVVAPRNSSNSDARCRGHPGTSELDERRLLMRLKRPKSEPSARTRRVFPDTGDAGTQNEYAVTAVLPQAFQGRAAAASRRAWPRKPPPRPRPKPKRKERGPTGAGLTSAGASEWFHAAEAQRRRGEEEAARTVGAASRETLGEFLEDDEGDSDGTLSDGGSAKLAVVDDHFAAAPSNRGAAVANLVAFLAVAGGRATDRALHDDPRTATDRVRFRRPDLRPALRVLGPKEGGE